MFCKNCGLQLTEGVKFCKNCGAPVTYVSANNVSNETKESTAQFPPVQTPSPAPKVEKPAYIPPAPAPIPQAAPRKKKGTSPALYVVLCIVSILLIASIVVLVMTINKKDDKGNGDNGAVTEKDFEISLTIDEYPEKTDENYYTLNGSISTEKDKATLSINGQKITSVTEDDGEKTWSKKVSLEEGENSFEIVLYTSGNNKIKTEDVEIIYEKPLLYPAGTVLIKADPDGVNVRPTPQISDNRIMLIPYDDFESQFVCQGEEHLDEENYIWCKVMTPNGEIGWVRSDLMKPLY